METDSSGPNRLSELPFVGDEPSRTEDAAHASESGKAADTQEPNPRLPRERVCVNPEHAEAMYEFAQLYAIINHIQTPVASTEHTLILVFEMTSVLIFSNSNRSCAWRDVNFMERLVAIIRRCPNTQLALWTNRSSGEMTRCIKNTVHSLVHTFGLPLHRISFAWTGERSTPAREMPHLFPPSSNPYQLIKDPATVYKTATETPHISLYLIASSDDSSCTLGWPTGHVLQLGTSGISDLTRSSSRAIIAYLRTLMRGFQEMVCSSPSPLYTPHIPCPMDTMDCNISYRQMHGTGLLDRFLEDWTNISAINGFVSRPPHSTFANSAHASAPLIEYTRQGVPPSSAPRPARTVHDGVMLTTPAPSRWANTGLRSPVHMSAYTIASGPFDYYALMHMAPRVEAGDLYPTNHLFDVSDHRSQTDFYPVDYIPELDYPPCDLRPNWRRCFTVTDHTPGASESQAKPFRLCRNPGCVGRRRLCFPNGGPPGTMGCSPGCMRLISKKFGYPRSKTRLNQHDPRGIPWILDELSLNAKEKDRMAETFIALMSSQFIGCPLDRGVVPRNPTSYDLDLLTALELAGHPRPPQGAPPHCFEASVSPKAFSFAQGALLRSNVFLAIQTQHGGHPVSIDISVDATFRPIDHEENFIFLDHRFDELFLLDMLSAEPAEGTTPPTCSVNPVNLLIDSDSDDDDQLTTSLIDTGCNQFMISAPPLIDAATASVASALASESTEHAALRFISTDLLAALNKLTQGRGSDSSYFDCLIKVAEGLPNTTPPAFRGKLSIRLLRSVNEHLPFTTFAIETTLTFPTKKLATSDTVRLFFNMYPEFHSLTL